MALTARQAARQARFVVEYCVDKNGTQAAIRAGYSPNGAEVTASRLLSRANVAAEIARELEQQGKVIRVDAARVLLEYARLAFADTTKAYGPDGKLLPLHQMPADLRRAISSFEVDRRTSDSGQEVTRLTKVKFHSKSQALEALGKHLNLFVDKLQVEGEGGPVTITINRQVKP